MPAYSKGRSYIFVDKDGVEYPFYGPTEKEAIRRAVVWARRHGFKLYRRKPSA